MSHLSCLSLALACVKNYIQEQPMKKPVCCQHQKPQQPSDQCIVPDQLIASAAGRLSVDIRYRRRHAVNQHALHGENDLVTFLPLTHIWVHLSVRVFPRLAASF